MAKQGVLSGIRGFAQSWRTGRQNSEIQRWFPQTPRRSIQLTSHACLMESTVAPKTRGRRPRQRLRSGHQTTSGEKHGKHTQQERSEKDKAGMKGGNRNQFKNRLYRTPEQNPRKSETKPKKSMSPAEEQDVDKTHSEAEENSRTLAAEAQRRQKAVSAPAGSEEMEREQTAEMDVQVSGLLRIR